MRIDSSPAENRSSRVHTAIKNGSFIRRELYIKILSRLQRNTLSKLLRRLIAKLTVNPAKILKIRRGTLAEGMPADVAVLDLKAERVSAVFVNGGKVLDEGKRTGLKPGQRIPYKG